MSSVVDGRIAPSLARGNEPSGAYRPDIDGLRALAVALVLFFHALPAFCPSGFVGVDVFFVISGYLITRILIGRSGQGLRPGRYFGDFYLHRIRRIFPALIVVLLAAALYGWFALFPADYASLTKYIAGGAGFVNNFLLAGDSGYFDQASELKPLTHLWSLAIEEQFYLAWPVLILLATRIRRGRYLLPTLGVLVALSFAYGVYVTGANPTLAYYSPLSRGWELGIGGILAALHTRGITARRGRPAEIVAAVALIAIIVSGFILDSAHFPGWEALLPVLATAAIIWFGAGTLTGRLLAARPFVFIGLVSYPLYLWHWVLLSFLRIRDPQPKVWMLAVAIAASFVLAVGTHYLIERPIKRFKLSTVSIVAGAVMLGLLIFGVAASTLHLSGVTLTSDQKALSRTYDPRPDYRYGTCFLDSLTQTASDFAPSCEQKAVAGRPRLLLWGDSLSAQFYPGLSSVEAAAGVTIDQRTASSCPPEVDRRYSDVGNCDDINAATRAVIARERPEIVLINGRWPEDPAARTAQISGVVDFLKTSGVKHVILAGPAPDWEPSLANILLNQLHPGVPLPTRSTPPADTWAVTQADDDGLATLAKRLGTQYISLRHVLCTGDQCLVRVSDQIPAGLITSDHDHLTAQASSWVFRRLTQQSFWSSVTG